MSIFTSRHNDKEVEFELISPGVKEQREATKEYNAAFTDSVKSGAMLRIVLDEHLEKQGLWNEEKKAKVRKLQQEILDGELTLKKGGIPKVKAREIALEMRKNRTEIQNLRMAHNQLDSHTAEGISDNAKFNALIAICLVYKTNRKRVYGTTEDYLNHLNDEVAIKASEEMVKTMTTINLDYEKDLEENKVLVKLGFANENLHLIDKEGNLVDIEGRKVDKNGRYINEANEYVDSNGHRVDEKGEYVVEFQEFTD